MTNQTQDDIDAELADFLGETTSTSANWRAEVPAGTVLAQGTLGGVEGAQVQYLKGNSMVTAGKIPLPERTIVYDTLTGRPSSVPTAQLRYQLSKRRADNTRIYSRVFPKDVVLPVEIEDTCRICYRNRQLAGAVDPKKKFYSEDDLLNHMMAFHSNEWAAMERDRDIKERRRSSDQIEKMLAVLTQAVMNPTRGIPDDVQEQLRTLQEQVTGMQASPTAEFTASTTTESKHSTKKEST